MAREILLLLLAPAAGLAVDALLQLALARVLALGPRRLQFVAFAGGGAVAAAILWTMLAGSPFSPADRLGYFALHLLIYACAGFFFFNVISANVSSLRVRILKEMLERHPAPMEEARLAASYSARHILATRLTRLQQGGQVEARDGRFYLRGSGILLIGGPFAALRRFLLKA
jgi:hypothetical protein